MKRLLLVVVICTVVAAMVPRQRQSGTRICEAQTPCGWVFYDGHPDLVQSTPDNSDYCKCASNEVCEVDKDEGESKTLIKKCKQTS